MMRVFLAALLFGTAKATTETAAPTAAPVVTSQPIFVAGGTYTDTKTFTVTLIPMGGAAVTTTMTAWDSSASSLPDSSAGSLASSESGSFNTGSSASDSSGSATSSGSTASGSSGFTLQIWQWLLLISLCLCCLGGVVGALLGGKKKKKKAPPRPPMPVPAPVAAPAPVPVQAEPETEALLPPLAPLMVEPLLFTGAQPSYAMPSMFAAPATTAYAQPTTAYAPTTYAQPSMYAQSTMAAGQLPAQTPYLPTPRAAVPAAMQAGARIKYLARSNAMWYPGVVQSVDPSGCTVKLDCTAETKVVAVAEIGARLRAA